MGLAAVVVAIVLIEQGWARFEALWAFGGAGGATLTGVWEGSLRAQRGAEYRLLLDLEYNWLSRTGRRGSRARLRGNRSTREGTGRVCTAGGAVHELQVSRGVADRTGRAIQLRVSHVDPRQSGLWVEWRGVWQGDRLVLDDASHNPFLSSGEFVQGRASSSADPPDALAAAELRKGTMAAFQDACRRLAGRA